MKRALSIITLVLQIGWTFIVIFCFHMLAAIMENDFGIEGIFGLITFQPIFAFIVTSVSIVACLIIGLPIRLNRTLNKWWTSQFYIPIIGIFLGGSLIAMAFLPYFLNTVTYVLDGEPTIKQIPNSTLAILGWFIATFSLLHTFPPRKLVDKMKPLAQKFFPISLMILCAIVFLYSCKNLSLRTKKIPILKADREAPLGWVYLTIYQDSTFDFVSRGLIFDKDVYSGKVRIAKDTMFFQYNNSIPKAGTTAVYNDKIIAYIDGYYPERVNITMNQIELNKNMQEDNN